MTFSPRVPKLPSRRTLLAIGAVFAQLFAAIGAPLPALRGSPNGKSARAPYPCQNLPCGCLTAEQCWAGPCCCFTMREKVAWAAEHGFAAPEHARQLADAEAASAEKGDCPRCRIKATEHAGVRPTASWVLGIHQQKCHGEGHGGIFAQAPAVAPLPPVSWQPESGVTASVWIASAHLVSLAQVPPAPPPRG